MLKDIDSSAIVAVHDIDRARDFYTATLGLDLLEDDGSVLTLRTGTTALVVYLSDFAGTNQANAVVWGVGTQFDDIVAALRAKNVTFEHYDMMERRGDIHVAGDFKGAWFKDPDGNLLHLNNM
ncbi:MULTISPECIES: VOC family protein [Devosia]|uniref:VOC family protein n=1 Tax=Devosia TaxID=46913 RepID=UPI0027340AEB|nr:VOC family protein [Devosia sp.]MDP2780688.1 VOC family protein [Devosia sp.]HLV83767.1 VOC family protein [Devosia sp.]